MQRWGLSFAGLLLILAIYYLPKVVVDNDPELAGIRIDENATADTHTFEISDADQRKISSLRNLINSTSENKNNAIFADSLANLYLRYNGLDSAVWYAGVLLKADSSIESQLLAGEIFFKAYGFSADSQQAKSFAKMAAGCFEKALTAYPNPDIEAKLAMTKVVTSNPMSGIMMLRKVLEEYPENKTALYSMGVLSMQSGQYDKAVERFEKLVSIDQANVQAAYYLAVSYFEIGNRVLAREWFVKIKNTGSDPAVMLSAEDYLKRLNEL